MVAMRVDEAGRENQPFAAHERVRRLATKLTNFDDAATE